MKACPDEDESVRHLVALGYVDPVEVAVREVAIRRQRQIGMHQAMDLNAQGRMDDSTVLLGKLRDDNPDWPPPRRMLAAIHYQAGRWTEAQSQLDWLAYHGVEEPRLALIAGAIALTRRNLDAALDDLQYAADVDPGLLGVDTLLGMALLRLRRLDAAEDAFRRAVQRNPSDARACDGLAVVRLKRGEFEDAADWALTALEHDMSHAISHYHLGVALAHMDRPQEAIAAMETFARLAPTRAAPYHWLSRISTNQLRDPARAAEYRDRGRERIRQRRRINSTARSAET
jgi:tetratricopeptide (TPR) repeat protein